VKRNLIRVNTIGAKSQPFFAMHYTIYYHNQTRTRPCRFRACRWVEVDKENVEATNCHFHSLTSNSLVIARVAARSSGVGREWRNLSPHFARALRRGRSRRPLVEDRISKPYGQRAKTSSIAIVFMRVFSMAARIKSTRQSGSAELVAGLETGR
jgi:hypothetical protein